MYELILSVFFRVTNYYDVIFIVHFVISFEVEGGLFHTWSFLSAAMWDTFIFNFFVFDDI